MIYVLAFVKTKPGMLAQALTCYRDLVPRVMANEAGCIEYAPTTDFDPCLPNQINDKEMIVVCERWKTIDDFKAHLTMPHTISFRSSIRHCLAAPITVKITQPAI